MIVVFGSLNVDIVMLSSKLPSPGETVIGADCLMVAGGKGANQACAAARAGGDVAMFGAVGNDDWAAQATATLAEAGVDIGGIGRGSRHTGCATIMVDRGGENAIVVASGANMEARADGVPDAMLTPDTWLVLQMEVDVAENWALIRRARDRGARILLNVAPAGAVPAEALDAVDILVVNQVEAAMIAAAEGLPSDDPGAALVARHGLTCVTTLGADGAVALGPEAGWRIGGLKVDPVDTTGAGDCFTGVLAATLAGGGDMPAAMRRASTAAALCCTVAGTQSSLPMADAIDARLGDLSPAERL